MFYAHFVLSKKGPLAKVWLAAHWERKLTKAHVFETNIEETVDDILNPKVKLALRTSGHLLLGVVRIYSRKAKYLLQDCNDALGRIKLAFRPVSIDLPAEHRVATKTAITLPATTKEMVPKEYNMTEIDFDMDFEDISDKELSARFAANQAHEDTITLKERIIGTDQPVKDNDLVLDFDDAGIDFSEDIFGDKFRGGEGSPLFLPRDDDGNRMLGNDFGQDNGFDDDDDRIPQIDELAKEGIPQPMPDGQPDSLVLPQDAIHSMVNEGPITNGDLNPEQEVGEGLPVLGLGPVALSSANNSARPSVEPSIAGSMAPPPDKPIHERMRAKRKRKLVIDEQKTISSDQMRQQLTDTSDIVRALDMAPSTLKLMYIKEHSSVEKMWNLPAYTGDDFEAPGFSHKLNEMFSDRALVPVEEELEDADDFFPASTLGESLLNHEMGDFNIDEPRDDGEAGMDQVLPDMPNILSPQRSEKSRNQEERSVAEDEQDDLGAQPDQEPFAAEPSRKRQKTAPTGGDGGSDDEQDEDAHPEDHDRMSRRTKVVFDQFATLVKRRHAPRHSNPKCSESVNFKELCRGHSTRKEVAQRFYSALVLKKLQAVDVEQAEPYGEIWLKKGGRFNQFDL